MMKILSLRMNSSVQAAQSGAVRREIARSICSRQAQQRRNAAGSALAPVRYLRRRWRVREESIVDISAAISSVSGSHAVRLACSSFDCRHVAVFFDGYRYIGSICFRIALLNVLIVRLEAAPANILLILRGSSSVSSLTKSASSPLHSRSPYLLISYQTRCINPLPPSGSVNAVMPLMSERLERYFLSSPPSLRAGSRSISVWRPTYKSVRVLSPNFR